MPLNKKEIVVVGSCMIDFISYTARLPQEGETIHGYKFITGLGGKGANQCVAAAKLGGKTSLIARVGNDMWGESYKNTLKEYNVQTEYFSKTEGFSSGVAQIIVSDSGSNQIVIVAGANTQLSAKDVEAAEKNIKNAAVLLCTLETPVEAAIKAMELCNGVSILNGAPALANCDSRLLTLPTIFCVNETEAEIFTGIPVKNTEDGKNAVRMLLSKGCNSVILTMGAEGVLYTWKSSSEIHFVKSPTVKAIDTTGAGDAFIGALAYLLSRDDEIKFEKAIEIACHIASDSVTKPGTQTSFPGPDILKQLL